MRQLITCFFFFIFTSFIFAQNTSTQIDTALAKQLLKTSSDLVGKRLFDSAQVKADSALAILLKIPQSIELAETHSILANLKSAKGEYAKSIEYEQKALAIKSEILGKTHLDCAVSLISLGYSYYEMGNNDKAIDCFQKSLEIRKASLAAIHPDIAAAYNAVAVVYFKTGNYDKSIEFYQKAIEMLNQMPSPPLALLGISLNNMGNIYSQKNEYIRAIEYYQKALDLRQKALGSSHPSLASSYYSLGMGYRGLTKYNDAIDFFKKALDISLKSPSNNMKGIGLCYNALGNCYNSIGEYDKAIENIEKAIDLQQKISPGNSSISNTIYNLATSYEYKKDYPKAIEFFKKAFSLFIKTEEKVQSNNRIAGINWKLKNPLAADSLYDMSLAILNFKDIKNLESVASLDKLVYTLIPKANFEYQWYKETNNIEHLKKANQDFKNALEVAYAQNKLMTTEGDRLDVKNTIHKINEGIILTNLHLASLTNDDNLKKNTFFYDEQSKAGLLQAQIKESDALHFGNIPSEILKKETDLRLNIVAKEKQRQDKISAGKTIVDTSVVAISGKIFDLRQEYDALKQTFEKDYPDYYRLKYNLKTTDIAEIQQKMLTPQQTLLSYFVGDSVVFAFVVRPDTFAVFTLIKDFPLEKTIKQLRDGLYGYHTAAVKTEKLYEMKADSFAQAAYLLHQKLLTPLSNLLSKEVIIVPDGVLGYIAFDVLLTENPKEATQFSTHSYFSKNHVISYNYSATLWQEMRNKKHKSEPKQNFIGFAPYYNGDTTLLSKLFNDDVTMRKGLDSLKYSGEEVFKAQKLMAGEAVLNQNATKQKFEQSVGNYRIIHLATHGKANDKMGDYCFLAFTKTKDSLENELLYVQDIYNLSLNAEMVVLSACETGIGELKSGEGIVSLARAFAYAGAKSMVTTLWSVNDKSTMQIMENFYRQLKKGQSKDNALWKAKQQYLEKAKNEMAHPYFWSAFIPIGDMRFLSK